jgi:pimeloyl-ACP methyl ester carboxylesterase
MSANTQDCGGTFSTCHDSRHVEKRAATILPNTPCGQESEPACADDCPIHHAVELAPIRLEDACARFRREARRGVCDTGRYRMPYYVWGEGPPLVFLHGVMDRMDGFVMPIARLAAHYRCIAYDLPLGHSDRAWLWNYRHDDLVEDLWALLDQEQAPQAYVLASSFGSTIALKAMHRRPDRLRRAILQGGFARRRLRPLQICLAWLARLLPGPTARLPYRDRILARLHADAFEGRDAARYDYLADCTSRTPIAAFAKHVLMLHDLDLRPLLPEVRQPVLLLCGDRDRVIPRPYDEVLVQGLPNVRRLVVEGCGHVPSYSHPELMAEVVRRFLTPPKRI